VQELLSKAKSEHSVAGRVEAFAGRFLGYPYQPNPLIGSADTAEAFTASFDGFDCVTYIETVLALAYASSVDDFIEWLRKIRYERGSIQWTRRNHFMGQWLRNNEREGVVRPVLTRTLPTVDRERVLNGVPGLAVRRTRIKCIPKPAVRRLAPHLRSGDLIFFASTHKNLDVFHAGIIVLDGKRILMRHASRSAGLVVEHELSEFLKSNRMAGVIVARPQQVPERVATTN
jgi:cell wall-associated NlpC family hydrolase